MKKSNTGKRKLSRGGGRILLILGAVAAAAVALVVVLKPPTGSAAGAYGGGSSSSDTDNGPTTQTQWGPLTAQDRVLLTKVRQAGLWEMPAGQMAQQRASSPRVKEVGNIIMQQHTQLDADVRATAQRLGAMLPAEPNADQKGWLQEMSGKTGPDFDKTFVLRLRAAHGKVFSVIATVRAQSQNTEIRAFAERCLKFVNTHMSLLESTGLVTTSALS